MGSSKKSAEKLAERAQAQGGYFTARQARDAGYVDAVHGYHLDNGDWEKPCRGVYRLSSFPGHDWPSLIIWWLWSRDKQGSPQGVYSHDTALMIHGVLPRSDSTLHMTVPRSFRKNCEIPSLLVLHKADLKPSEIDLREGYSVTTPARTRQDMGQPAVRRDYNEEFEGGPFLIRHPARSFDEMISAGED